MGLGGLFGICKSCASGTVPSLLLNYIQKKIFVWDISLSHLLRYTSRTGRYSYYARPFFLSTTTAISRPKTSSLTPKSLADDHFAPPPPSSLPKLDPFSPAHIDRPAPIAPPLLLVLLLGEPFTPRDAEILMGAVAVLVRAVRVGG